MFVFILKIESAELEIV